MFSHKRESYELGLPHDDKAKYQYHATKQQYFEIDSRLPTVRHSTVKNQTFLTISLLKIFKSKDNDM